ncbi:MAG: hypothetical protein SGILL_009846 [Bacillariaceae sp.]
MGFFGKKKKKDKASQQAKQEQEAPRSQKQNRNSNKQKSQPTQTTVVKYVGESKHVTTTTVNEVGRQTSQTQVMKLTPEEMEELGIVPKTDDITGLDTRHHDVMDEQSMAGYSMAGYSVGAFSDVLPPPSFQDNAKKQQQQSLKQQATPYQPPPNMMETPYEGDPSIADSSQISEDQEAEQRLQRQKEKQELARQQEQERREEDDRRQQEYHQKQRERQLQELTATSATASTAAGSVDRSTSTPSSEAEEYMAAVETTRELVKKFISDIWNRGEVELIPKVCHPSLRFNGHVGMDRVGHEGFARMVTTVREALSEYHCEIHSMVVESTKAFCRLRFTGKHTGNLLGYPPTGKTVAWMGASEFTCKNGKILKVWELGDLKSLEEQLKSPSK